MNIDKQEALKEIGKGLINLGNLIGGLSFVNIFMQKDFAVFDVSLVMIVVVQMYIAGFLIIKGAKK